MSVTNNIGNIVKKFRGAWGRKERKKYFKYQVRRNEKDIMNIDINEYIKVFRGPICRICDIEYSKYDDTICKNCSDGISRLSLTGKTSASKTEVQGSSPGGDAIKIKI